MYLNENRQLGLNVDQIEKEAKQNNLSSEDLTSSDDDNFNNEKIL